MPWEDRYFREIEEDERFRSGSHIFTKSSPHHGRVVGSGRVQRFELHNRVQAWVGPVSNYAADIGVDASQFANSMEEMQRVTEDFRVALNNASPMIIHDEIQLDVASVPQPGSRLWNMMQDAGRLAQDAGEQARNELANMVMRYGVARMADDARIPANIQSINLPPEYRCSVCLEMHDRPIKTAVDCPIMHKHFQRFDKLAIGTWINISAVNQGKPGIVKIRYKKVAHDLLQDEKGNHRVMSPTTMVIPLPEQPPDLAQKPKRRILE